MKLIFEIDHIPLTCTTGMTLSHPLPLAMPLNLRRQLNHHPSFADGSKCGLMIEGMNLPSTNLAPFILD